MAATYERKKLTKADCDKATTDGQRQKLFLDTELPGFGLLVGQRVKTFIVQRAVPGHGFERCKVDRYGVITLDEARRRGRDMLLAMGRGESQVAHRRRKPVRGMTLQDAWDLHKGELAKDRVSAKTLLRYEGMLRLYLADWVARPLTEITRKDVRERHQTIKDDIAAGRHALSYRKRKAVPYNRTGESTANGCVRLLAAIWNTALREDDKKGQDGQVPPNPTVKLRGFKVDLSPVKQRAANLQANLRQWHDGLLAAEIPTTRRDLLLFMLYTGMRRTAATEVRREHINFEQRTLHIPKPKGGTEKAFDLPLSDYVVDLLQRRLEENAAGWPQSPWLFPADSKSGHINEIRAAVGVPYIPHDLRRVFASVAESLDVSRYAIKALLNHAQPKDDVTGRYMNLAVERLRGPMQLITDQLREMCVGPEPEPSRDNVVPIATRQRVSA